MYILMHQYLLLNEGSKLGHNTPGEVLYRLVNVDDLFLKLGFSPPNIWLALLAIL